MSEHRVDTRKTAAATIGTDMWAAAGDMSIEKAHQSYGSYIDVAYAAANVLHEAGVAWIDYDGKVLPIPSYILAYISDRAI